MPKSETDAGQPDPEACARPYKAAVTMRPARNKHRVGCKPAAASHLDELFVSDARRAITESVKWRRSIRCFFHLSPFGRPPHLGAAAQQVGDVADAVAVACVLKVDGAAGRAVGDKQDVLRLKVACCFPVSMSNVVVLGIVVVVVVKMVGVVKVVVVW